MVQVRTPFLTNFLVAVTNIGSPFILSIISIFVAILLLLHKDAYDALLFIVAMALSIVALTVLKNTFQIHRPVTDLISVAGWSFPSGHATVATAFFFNFAHAFFSWFQSPAKKTVLVVGSMLGALLACFSRLYLGAHWALDILAGAALGFLCVSFTMLIFSIFLEPRRQKISSLYPRRKQL